MPVVKGIVGDKSIDVLRDTGCSGIVIKKEHVSEDQYTADFNSMLLIGNTEERYQVQEFGSSESTVPS